MNKIMVAAVAAICGVCAFAENLAPDMVVIPGKGKIAFVNASGVSDSALRGAAENVRNSLMINAEVKGGNWSFATARKNLSDTGANVAVFVVKDSSLPLSLIAMEEKWGVVNASGLSDTAISKEALRVGLVVLGAAASKNEVSVMTPVFSVQELEKMPGDSVTIESLMSIFPTVESLGITQIETVDYTSALRRGIAPEPTNDVQRKLKKDYEKKVADRAARRAAAKAADGRKK